MSIFVLTVVMSFLPLVSSCSNPVDPIVSVGVYGEIVSPDTIFSESTDRVYIVGVDLRKLWSDSTDSLRRINLLVAKVKLSIYAVSYDGSQRRSTIFFSVPKQLNAVSGYMTVRFGNSTLTSTHQTRLSTVGTKMDPDSPPRMVAADTMHMGTYDSVVVYHYDLSKDFYYHPYQGLMLKGRLLYGSSSIPIVEYHYDSTKKATSVLFYVSAEMTRIKPVALQLELDTKVTFRALNKTACVYYASRIQSLDFQCDGLYAVVKGRRYDRWGFSPHDTSTVTDYIDTLDVHSVFPPSWTKVEYPNNDETVFSVVRYSSRPDESKVDSCLLRLIVKNASMTITLRHRYYYTYSMYKGHESSSASRDSVLEIHCGPFPIAATQPTQNIVLNADQLQKMITATVRNGNSSYSSYYPWSTSGSSSSDSLDHLIFSPSATIRLNTR